MILKDKIRETLCKPEYFGNHEIDLSGFFNWFLANSETFTCVVWHGTNVGEDILNDDKHSFKIGCCHINSIYNSLNFQYDLYSGVSCYKFTSGPSFYQHSYNVRNLGEYKIVYDFSLYNDLEVKNMLEGLAPPSYQGVMIPREFIKELIGDMQLNKDSINCNHVLNRPLFAELYKSKH